MRYSGVLLTFYRIQLGEVDRDLVDCAFTGASHHYLRIRDCQHDDVARFHLLRHRAHLRWLMSIVFFRGDFSYAIDESCRGLSERSAWNPELNFSLPDPAMFNSMAPDPSVKLGEAHPNDMYLAVQEDKVPGVVRRLAS